MITLKELLKILPPNAFFCLIDKSYKILLSYTFVNSTKGVADFLNDEVIFLQYENPGIGAACYLITIEPH